MMQMTLGQYIPKEDPELPDAYSIKVWYHGEKDPIELELASHTMVDKVWAPAVNADGSLAKTPEGLVVYRVVGVLAAPYLEYKTKDDLFGIIPMGSYKRIEFDKRYSKIEALREKKRNATS